MPCLSPSLPARLLHSVTRFGALLIFFTAQSAPAATVTLTDPSANYSAFKNPCPRGDANDFCQVISYLDTVSAADGSSDPFADAWNAWNGAQPAGQRWTLVQGRALTGTISITRFGTYDDCPGTGGVEVRATFTPGAGDPANWNWCQGLSDNYDTGAAPPHNGPPAAPRLEMDVDPAGANLPPLYPFQYADGHFYDRPGAYCIHESDVYFYATALICSANRATRTLTVYEGFNYGFDFTCEHIPEPASLVLLAIGGLFGLLRRR